MNRALYQRWIRLRDRVVPPATRRRALYDRVSWAIVRRVLPNLDVDKVPVAIGYAAWLARHSPDLTSLRQVDTRGWPSISVLLLGVDPTALAASRDSLERQVHAAHTVCVAADLPTALAQAQNDVVVLLEAGDQLAPDALFCYAEALRSADAAYADEDRLDVLGRFCDPFFKPDWSPELLSSMNYVGAALAVRRPLVVELAPRDAYDLALGLTERAATIEHLPRVLYHAASDRPIRDERPVLEHALRRRAIDATVTSVAPGRYRTRYAIAGTLRVAIIIPTRDRVDLLRVTIDSIRARSTWTNYEIIVVDNGSRDPDTLDYLDKLAAPHRVLRDPRVFNWAALNNGAVPATDAPLLLFLNNDVEVITPDWLESLIEHAQRPEVGTVGCKLLYPSGKIQHAGVVLGIHGVASHAFLSRPDDGTEYKGLSSVVREYSAVTGACLMVRREVFDEVGGFDESLRVAFNDVDFCLRIGALGLRNVYTPWAKLYHYESASRGPGHPPEDEAAFRARWGDMLEHDPFFSPHFSLRSEQFELRTV